MHKQNIINFAEAMSDGTAHGNSEAKKGGNNTRLVRTDDVNVYIEYCKKLKPSIYSSESHYE